MKLSDNEILYEDNHLLIIDKPSCLLTLPSEGVVDSALERSKIYLKEAYQKPGNVYLHQIHRLDRSASGILVMAKTSKALSRLNEQIRDGLWEKTYLARTEKLPKEMQGELIHYLKKEDYRTRVVAKGTPLAKEAHLTYKVRQDGLLEILLHTGRYHQIRAQLAAIGCPIRGDQKYGSTMKGASEGIDLHHAKLRFIHPVHKEIVTVYSKNCPFLRKDAKPFF